MNKSNFLAPSRLQAAREFRGWSKKQLAEKVGLSPAAIGAYESNQWQPAPELVKEIASELDFPVTWFAQDELNLVDEYALSFRCQSRMSATLRKQSARVWDFAALISTNLRRDFNLPEVCVPDLCDETPEVAARLLRDEWLLGHEPIDHLVGLLESKGVMVFWSHIDSRTVDAYCHWDDNNPIVVLNRRLRDGARSRFNAAHELGHLVMHRESVYRQRFSEDEEEGEGESRQAREKEANAFASAFLLPEDEFAEETPLQPHPEAFEPLKEKWGVSIAAMIRRNMDLEVFSPDQYERAMTRLSGNGWRIEEPGELDLEESIVHQQVLESLKNDGVCAEDLARSLHIRSKDIFSLMPLACHFNRIENSKRSFRKPDPTIKGGKVTMFPKSQVA